MQDPTKLPLSWLLLFLAVAAGSIYYYYDKEHTGAENTTAGTTVIVPVSPAPDMGALQPGSPAASLPVISPPVQNTNATAATTEAVPGPTQATENDADGQPPAGEPQPEAPSTEAPDAQAHAPSEETPLPSAEHDLAAPQPVDNTETKPSEEHGASGVVLYGKGRPITPGGHVVRGDIPAGQEKTGARIASTGQDSVVGLALVQDLATFLAENYWPANTHLMAREHGISTADVRRVNYRYGEQLHGFAAAHNNPGIERERVLRYVFAPSMLRALYRLYDERFFSALRTEAAAQKRGPAQSPLTPLQIAEMFGIYSGMAQSLAEAVRTYADTPRIRSLVAAYVQASTETADAFTAYAESREQGNYSAKTSQAYQSALKRREQAKDALASAMRRGGARQELDAESLAYIAQWLYRRGENAAATLAVLAEILEDCALRLSAIQQEYPGSRR
ncbi:MAG: hypothetical protein FWG04_03025 [Desulfovibrionaceae bacterium]|nr:hypothetical protein [Desulfovibrionaceae bacterium]